MIARTAGPQQLRTPEADLEYLILGSGEPVTVFAHGLAGTMDELRGMAGGVQGTRVLFNFRGHGGSTCRPEAVNGYAGLADDLRAMAAHTGARRILGLSMGASAAVRVLGQQPNRFERAVLLRPTTLDTPLDTVARREARAVTEAAERGDLSALQHFVTQRIPGTHRRQNSALDLIAARVDVLTSPGGRATLAAMVTDTPRTPPARLREVGTATLVVGVLGDALHPESTAQRIAAAVPGSELHICRTPGAAWTRRAHICELAVSFLNEPTAPGLAPAA
ncbi:alpha/beta fold hydrolase [Streptomyces chrestomyceticus]|uniref:alpha/beta fold hydrolase n=1 Tax=Streptomyces chrestomyceticus TaxID=68185 RepID=UPI0019D25851|nr:alpha/beta hydrolase [Streptomyces chrestomyceticus]